MYKFLSIALAAMLLIAGLFYLFENRAHSKSRRELSNEIAKLEGMVQETDTAVSRRGVEVSNLETKNKELQGKIDDKDEDIVALADTVLKWKDKFFEIKGAKETVVDESGSEIVLDSDCEFCLKGRRFKVSFDEEKDYLRIYGYTLTSPGYAQVGITWIRGLKLNLILTRNKDNSFRIYLDPENPDIVPAELTLIVDTTLFETPWYGRIGIGADIFVGPGVQTNLKIFYDILPNMFVGPSIGWLYDDEKKFKRFYGVNIGYYPWR